MLQLKLAISQVILLAYDNTVDAFVPKLWAEESLAILEENMVAGMLIHRDFEPIVANFGDTVNTRRPGQFKSKRKTTTDSVTVQDATATNVQVSLNQHLHVSFLIRDGEESKSFKDLITEYMAPAMLAQARAIDQIVLGQAYQFIGNSYGGLAGLTSSNARDSILGTRKVMNQNKAYVQNRNMLLTPNSETALLNLDLFTAAQYVGDDGTALREASLGRKLGFDLFMCQNTPSVSPMGSSAVATDTTAGAKSAGATTVTLTTGTDGTIVAGNWFTIAGDNTPLQIASYNSGTKVITLVSPLKSAVSNGAVVTFYKQGAVNLVAGYAAGWSKEIVYDVFPVDPEVGQMVSFKTDTTYRYAIIQVDTVAKTILLDRPLDIALADDDVISVGPSGDYNFAFHRNALALVVRPLAMPRAGTGALSAVVNYNDLSMRATITYDGNKQGHLVTLDMLCGVAVLDTNLGAVMLG